MCYMGTERYTKWQIVSEYDLESKVLLLEIGSKHFCFRRKSIIYSVKVLPAA